MTDASPFTKPGRKPGGDSGVERDGLQRPLIWLDCQKCEGSGKVPSTKLKNRLNKCQTCKGEGRRKQPFTRVTTWIDALEDKSSLSAWKSRLVLIGSALDPSLLDEVVHRAAVLEDPDPEEARKAKTWFKNRVEKVLDKAGANLKSETGTRLHELSEIVDGGKELPDESSFEDVIDMAAYKRFIESFDLVAVETLVVNDEIQAAGTPDRIGAWKGEPLTAPDGSTVDESQPLILDLKTGNLQYGVLKIAMQLAVYARASNYDPATGERSSLGDINQKWGMALSLQPGTGILLPYWVDLTLGWKAVQLAGAVRAMRTAGRKALEPIEHLCIEV